MSALLFALFLFVRCRSLAILDEAHSSGLLGLRLLPKILLILSDSLLLELRVALLERVQLGIYQIDHVQVAIHINSLAVRICLLVVEGLKFGLHDLLALFLDVGASLVDFDGDLGTKLLHLHRTNPHIVEDLQALLHHLAVLHGEGHPTQVTHRHILVLFVKLYLPEVPIELTHEIR